jgi:hypothetical protein
MMNKNRTISPLVTGCVFALLIGCAENEDFVQPDLPNEPSIYVDIPDDNFERKLIALGIDTDDSLNNRILRSDASKITSLKVDSPMGTPEEEKITDLTGIEAFENLVYLSAGNNAIVKVDLVSNTKLEIIHLEVNFIQQLDVRHNTQLVELSLLFNDLTEIKGINEAMNLKSLNLSWNYLTDLSINNSSLEGLNVENNLLRTLDLTGCKSLISIIAKQNELVTLDLTTNVALKYLTISTNRLNELNLDNNLNVEKLLLSGNELYSLDVTNLKLLNLLDIRKNMDLKCVKIADGQVIATVNKQEHQKLNKHTCL